MTKLLQKLEINNAKLKGEIMKQNIAIRVLITTIINICFACALTLQAQADISDLAKAFFYTRIKPCASSPYPSNTGYTAPMPILESPQVWSFVSAPNLHPMKVTVRVNKPGTSPGFIFVAPYAFSGDTLYGQPGALIMTSDGDPVWFRPLNNPNLMNMDFRVQTLYGKPVLTFWQGTMATPPAYTNLPAAAPEPGCCYYILDNRYRVIKNVKAQKGYTPDIHEFLLTPHNTALILSTKEVPMDLTSYGGPANGYVQDFAIQEIDVKTNKLLFFWNALAHIPLTDSYEPASSANSSNNNTWDAYHLNSVGLTDNVHEILVSGRNTWTIYKIDKPTKNIIWRLGGKNSSFTFDSNAQFSWQHDARFLPDNTISLFDDNCCESTIPPGTPYAHGLVLQLNLTTMHASLQRSYFHNPNLQVASQGNVQSLKNGNKFVGWGQNHYFSEFKNAGNTVNNPSVNLIYDAKMPGNNYTYRAYRHEWVGRPYYAPSIAARKQDGHITIYASWNGSTQTVAWQLFGGFCPNKLSIIKTVHKKGFETAIATSHCRAFYQVKAVDSQGNVIGVSKVTRVA